MRNTLLIGLLSLVCIYSIGQSSSGFFQATDLNSFPVKAINFTDLDQNPELRTNSPALLSKLKEDGFNTIRIEVNLHQLVRHGKYPYIDRELCKWIDSISVAAEALDLKLMLTLRNHSSEVKANPGFSYWTDRHIQLEHIYVWLQLAEKYKDNKTIIGYDILPAPSKRVKNIQFTYIANELISAIRTRDPNHLIIVNGLNKYLTDWREAESLKFKDNNVALSGAFEYEQAFRIQKTEWAIDQKGLRFKGNDHSALTLADHINKIDSAGIKFKTPILINDFGLSKKTFKSWRNGRSYFIRSKQALDTASIGYCSQSFNGNTFGLYKFKKDKVKTRGWNIKRALKPYKRNN
jgi:hypothetical protein